MADKPLSFTTPVGRLVGGSLYDPRTTDYDGKPLVVKTGPNAGKPRVEFSFGVAIPKTPGATHWSQEKWGAPIWALAHAAFPEGAAQRPDFAWKITDGDSAIPNKRNVKPCDREGYKGHWVVWFSGGTAPRVYNANGTQLILEKDAVKNGYYVQVFGNVTDNKPSASPGLYINHSMVAFAAYGEEIQNGPDVSQAGFGQGATLPPGASTAPPAGAIPATGAAVPPPPAPPGAAVVAPPPPPVATSAEEMVEGRPLSAWIASGWTREMLVAQGKIAPAASVPPPLPGGSVAPPAPPAPTVVAPPPLPVTPNPDMRAVPAPPPEKMVEGQPLSAWIAKGWTEAQLIQHGKMAA